MAKVGHVRVSFVWQLLDMQRENLSESDKLLEEERSGSTDARPMLTADPVTELRKERSQGVLIRILMADYGLERAPIYRCFVPRNA